MQRNLEGFFVSDSVQNTQSLFVKCTMLALRGHVKWCTFGNRYCNVVTAKQQYQVCTSPASHHLSLMSWLSRHRCHSKTMPKQIYCGYSFLNAWSFLNGRCHTPTIVVAADLANTQHYRSLVGVTALSWAHAQLIRLTSKDTWYSWNVYWRKTTFKPMHKAD